MAKATRVDISKPIMPKATAVWLIDNTLLTFNQIAEFTELHTIEVQALADGDIGQGIVGKSPIDAGLLTQDEIKKCEEDNSKSLKAEKSKLPPINIRSKGPRYTPVSKRGDKPDAIAYLVKNHPEISDAQICKLVGTTKPTIKAIRERSHANIANIRPRNPADLGLCTYKELDAASAKGHKAAGRDPEEELQKRKDALAKKSENAASAMTDSNDENGENSGEGTSAFDFSNFLKS